MKKLFLTLIAVVAVTLSGFAQISLSDAYTSLVNLPGMQEKSVDNVQLNQNSQITNLQAATCTNSKYAQEFIYTYESLPITNVILGANNSKEMACCFTEPSDNGIYNVLFLVGEKGGPYVAAYGQTDENGIQAIRNSDVSMNGNDISMQVAPQIDVVEFISMEIFE